jgi:predicted RNA-binding protein YlqC (UPF0109 family)
MSSIDQQFVEFIVKSLVGKPDAVTIERRIDEKGVLLELTVDPDDLGRVIGKRGATAQSLRTLLRALGTKNDARYNLKIIDNGEPGAGLSQPASDDNSTSDDAVADDEAAEEPTARRDDLSDLKDDDDDDDDSKAKKSEGSSVVSKTRKELEELDDLDV